MTGNLENWGEFCGSNFLKVEHVKNETDAFAVVNVEIFEDDANSKKPRLTLEKADGRYLFDLNVTNSNFCKNAGIKAPKELVGHKICFRKINVTSPKTKKEVESLRICKIE